MNSAFQVTCFVHLFEQATQDWLAVAGIIKSCIEETKAKFPQVNEIFLRSDNAGCYHSSSLLLSLPTISTATGVSIARYDYSEPQKGKDVCDRKIAVMKTDIRRHVNEGNDVTTAMEMKEALESHGGAKDCFSAVAEVSAQAKMTKQTFAGVQSYSNFEFTGNGVRVWKAYNIGPGKEYEKKFDKTTDFSLKFHDHFKVCVPEATAPQPKRQKVQDPQANLPPEPSENPMNVKGFPCPEINCIKEFVTFSGLQRHLDVGRHVLKVHEDNPPDYVKKKWAEVCTSLTTKHVSAPAATSSLSEEESDVHMGWAVKSTRKVVRFSDKVKGHLLQLFIEGEDAGHKAHPAEVAMHMKKAKGKFSRQEWLTSQQVKSYFSRLTSLKRAGKLPLSSQSNPDPTADDTAAEEAEAHRREIRRSVSADIDL